MLVVEGKPRPPQRNHANQEQTWHRLHALLSRFTITCGADIARGKTDCRSTSHAGDERGNRPNTGAVVHQRGYGAVARQTGACWSAPEPSGR
jgi:hypothetical protein